MIERRLLGSGGGTRKRGAGHQRQRDEQQARGGREQCVLSCGDRRRGRPGPHRARCLIFCARSAGVVTAGRWQSGRGNRQNADGRPFDPVRSGQCPETAVVYRRYTMLLRSRVRMLTVCLAAGVVSLWLAAQAGAAGSFVLTATDTGSTYAPTFTGNGLLGVRVPPEGQGYAAGTVPAQSELAGFYAKPSTGPASNQVQQRANTPTWSTLTFSDGGQPFSTSTGTTSGWRQSIDLHTGIVSTNATWTAPDGHVTDLELPGVHRPSLRARRASFASCSSRTGPGPRPSPTRSTAPRRRSPTRSARTGIWAGAATG